MHIRDVFNHTKLFSLVRVRGGYTSLPLTLDEAALSLDSPFGLPSSSSPVCPGKLYNFTGASAAGFASGKHSLPPPHERSFAHALVPDGALLLPSPSTRSGALETDAFDYAGKNMFFNNVSSVPHEGRDNCQE